MQTPDVEYNLIHEGDRWALKLGYKPSEWDALSAQDKARLIATIIVEDEIEMCVNSFDKYRPAVGVRQDDLQSEIERIFQV